MLRTSGARIMICQEILCITKHKDEDYPSKKFETVWIDSFDNMIGTLLCDWKKIRFRTMGF